MFPNNILQNVQTYQKAGLALAYNTCPLLRLANKKFKDFQNKTANLGSAVTFDLPPRFTSASGLVITIQELNQRVLNLTCDQSANTSFAYTAEQLIFNVRDYMEEFGKSAIAEWGSKVEANLGTYITGTTPVYNIVNGQPVPDGTYHSESGPNRFFGNGVSAINSYNQLAQAVADYRTFGDAGDLTGVLPVGAIPSIIGSGLNQFVPGRNEKAAISWELGNFARTKWYESNMLPTFYAGNVGNDGLTLTVVSTNDPTGQNVTQITCSGAATTDPNAVFNGDMAQFIPVNGVTPKLLTFIGHNRTPLPFQFRVTQAAGSTAGQVVLNTNPPICWQSGNSNQNVDRPIVAGMQLKLLPDHQVGVLYSNKYFFLAMPMMPSTMPFPSGNKNDPTTGASMRQYYGFLYGQNQYGMTYDGTWAGVMVPEQSMRIAFPV